MLLKEGVFENGTNNITSGNEVTLAQAFKWLEIPKFVLIKIWKLDTSWNEHVLISQFSNCCEWSLNTIKNCLQNTWSKLDRKWVSSSQDWISISEARSIFIALDGGGISLKLNNFSYQFIPSNLNQFVHFGSRHVLSNDQWSCDFVDSSVL